MSTLDHLKAERAELSAEAKRLNDTHIRLDGLHKSVDDAQAELARFDAATSERVAEWALAGAQGEPPDGPVGEHGFLGRSAISRRVARAQAAVVQAGLAKSQLVEQSRDINAKLAAVNSKIQALALDELETTHAEALDSYRALILDHVMTGLAKLLAAPQALYDLAAPHTAAGRTEEARALCARAAALLKPIQDGLPGAFNGIDVPHTAVAAATTRWQRQLADATGDKPMNLIAAQVAA